AYSHGMSATSLAFESNHTIEEESSTFCCGEPIVSKYGKMKVYLQNIVV
ncbi:hypothetical protein EDD68_1368, partial [Melghiribacillus thermohalophilus]